MNFEIPLINSEKLNISFENDKPTFILGANGTGKSSLIYSIFRQFPEINIISAHRANWLDQESISLGGNTKEQYESWIQGSLLSDNARWSENHYLDKTKVNLINLIDSEHKRAREITDLVDKDLFDEVKILKSEQSIVNKINELFRSCNLGIEINVASNSQINAIKNDHIYSVSKMSDGERNALLIASNVLLTKLDSLIIIDEPERHLHHSITIPFVNNLIKLRPDLKFIISTHDIGFAQSFDDSQFILLNGCNYINQHSIVWDAQLLSSENLSNLEHISRNILGSRKKIIFIEGENNSLDLPIYSLIFPNVSVIPKVTCKEVMQNVRGIKSADFLHWLNVYGIIDRDGREDSECEKLKNENIFCLEQYSIESIYYHPFLQKKVYLKKVELEGEDGIYNPESYIDELLGIFTQHKVRLCNRLIEKTVRNQFESKIPTQQIISTENNYEISINLEQIRINEETLFNRSVENKDIIQLLSRYPIRETPLLECVRKKLGFQTKSKYENTVIQILKRDEEVLEFVREYFRDLIVKIEA